MIQNDTFMSKYKSFTSRTEKKLTTFLSLHTINKSYYHALSSNSDISVLNIRRNLKIMELFNPELYHLFDECFNSTITNINRSDCFNVYQKEFISFATLMNGKFEIASRFYRKFFQDDFSYEMNADGFKLYFEKYGVTMDDQLQGFYICPKEFSRVERCLKKHDGDVNACVDQWDQFQWCQYDMGMLGIAINDRSSEDELVGYHEMMLYKYLS